MYVLLRMTKISHIGETRCSLKSCPILRLVKEHFGLPQLRDLPQSNITELLKKIENKPIDDIKKQMTKLSAAQKKAEICQSLEPTLVNGYYKMAEIITIERILNNHVSQVDDTVLKELAVKNITMADSLSKQDLSVLYVKYAFHRFDADDTKADEIKAEIDCQLNNKKE